MKVEKIFQSNKKTITKDILLKTLSVIGELGVSFEGEGGKCAYYGDDYEVGTGLRAPDMPLYNRTKAIRHCILKHLESKNMIMIIDKRDDDEWKDFKITLFGMGVLREYNVCNECNTSKKWYYTTGFYQTDVRSGFRYNSRQMFCDCKLYDFKRECVDSQNSNNKKLLGKQINTKPLTLM